MERSRPTAQPPERAAFAGRWLARRAGPAAVAACMAAAAPVLSEQRALADASRIERARGPERCDPLAAVMGLGVGPGFAGISSRFRPTHVVGSTCVLWLAADRGVVLAATLRASGTSPPAATVAGSGSTIQLRIEITTGGTLGNALFRWSTDGGTTWTASNVATAASVVLGTTGRTVSFPAGTYSVDNVYLGAVSAWNDQSGLGNNGSGAGTTAPQVVWAGPNGLPAISFSGATSQKITLPNAFSALTAAEIFVVVKRINPVGANDGLYLFGSSGAATLYPWAGDSNLYDDFGSTTRKACGAPIATITNWNVYGVSSAAGAWTNRFNGTQQFTTAANVVGWSGTPLIGNAFGSLPIDAQIAEIAMFSSVLSAGERARMQSYLRWRAATP